MILNDHEMLKIFFDQYRVVNLKFQCLFSVQCNMNISMIGMYQDTNHFITTLLPLSQIDRPVDNIEEEEGEREEGSCIEVNAFGGSRYDRFRWWGFLVTFVLGLVGS